ncbi:T9SS type A sorting domain-containing protein [Pinibacter aurantiacus]|uniref:T9SS type A sorting domain-containing protein n=1 Tax=Pinibacter aurantiacus TaxID=2851599 RepID=A0A9E2W5Q6_9BACT|nr:T9SS type A sorting domain-containing protein [Pinibacter aurantiacus]MBV4358908.1 T9SS type A sorting domain-containing protein [Pinibacter aurantiacus]
MKQTIGILLMLISIYAKASSCKATKNGNWETAATWSCGHVPAAGDNVTIDAGFTVTVTGNNTVAIGNLDISGTLDFTNGSKISLGSASVVVIHSGGDITGGNPGAKLVFPSYTIKGSFAVTGPYYFNNNGQGVGAAPLPLTLVSFTASLQQNQQVILYWRTANEENIHFFQIESTDYETSGWLPVDTISPMAPAGGSYSYAFNDRNKLNGDRYYRLKIVDRDGKYVFSKIIVVTSHQTATFSVKPTLVNNSMTVDLPSSGPAEVSIFNTFGQLVKTLTSDNQSLSIDVSMLSRGLYFLKLVQGKNSYTTRFFKQ